MTRTEFERFLALTKDAKKTVGRTLEISVEVKVDGQWEEITDLPAVRENCTDIECELCRGSHLVEDMTIINQFPEIAKELEEHFAADAEFASVQRAERRAEMGYRDA